MSVVEFEDLGSDTIRAIVSQEVLQFLCLHAPLYVEKGLDEVLWASRVLAKERKKVGEGILLLL